MAKIDKEYIMNTCKIGQGADCCRYVVAGTSGIECAKLTSMKETIDQRVETGQFTATSDNCDGVDNINEDAVVGT